MSNGCYVGRGSLLVASPATGGGFFTLSGESELFVNFQEDNESIQDARHGVNERIEWYVRNYRVVLNADCFRIEKDALELLLKSKHTAVAPSVAPVALDSIEVGRDYLLRPSIAAGTVVVSDSTAAVIPATEYTVDLDYGLIRFNVVSGTLPYSVVFSSAAYDHFSLNAENQIQVKALFKGFDKASQRKVMAEFYRLAIDISTQFALVQRGFSGLTVQMQATPDVNQPLDPVLGQYGRLILL